VRFNTVHFRPGPTIFCIVFDLLSQHLRALMQLVHLGIVGGGTVGGGVFQGVQRNGALMASRLGIRLNVAKVAVRDLKKKRPVSVPAGRLTTKWREVVEDPRVQIVVELMGGTKTAREVTLRAFELGKPVVTANKALISEHGEELFAAASKHDVNFYYEAAVAGGIPIIKVLREGLIGNRITRLYGILNGTCNYILTRMKNEGVGYADVLAEAQRLGYAEADPALDVGGIDASHKAGILASLAHGFWVNPKQIYVEGVDKINQLDIRFAEQLGYTIKLLAIVKRDDAKGRKANGVCPPVQVTVCPTLVPNTHVMASVNDVFNAVFVRGDIVGDTLYYGRGAGQDATASAVLSDLADAALDLKFGAQNRIPPFVPHEHDGSVKPLGEVVTAFYIRLNVVDRPGVMANVAAVLAKNGIGISSVIQPEGHEGKSVPLMLMIHDASYAAMQKALKEISKLPAVKGRPVMYPVEHFD